MSRLHRQKLRLRSQQRGDGLIEPDARTIDRDAFQEVGTNHAGVRQALELVERHGTDDDVPQLPAIVVDAGQAGADPLRGLSAAELAEVREYLAQRRAQHASAEPSERPAGTGGAQNPPL